MTRHLRTSTLLASAAVLLSACSGGPLDIDLRSMGRGPDTSNAAAQASARPRADANGVISYPTYQVAVARRGDTVTTIAQRLGLGPTELARYNGIKPDAPLRDGELLALPTRVAPAASKPIVNSTTLPAATTGDRGTSGPVRHQVGSGETAFSIARLYDVPVQALAQWNGLGSDLAVREGQFLLIPPSASRTQTASATATLPDQGTRAPVPPSSTTALPAKVPEPITSTATAAASTGAAATSAAASTPAPTQKPAAEVSTTSARMVRPVPGNIFRAYNKGRNDGVDFTATAGTTVKAADKGSVAAITEDTKGAKIVVLRHSDGLLTVYVNVSDVSVSKGASVSRGQSIAKVAGGSVSGLHFEVRRGLESLDPTDFLP